MSQEITVQDNPTASRYEANVDGKIAEIVYERDGDLMIYLHTEVPEELEGRGIASKMAKYALDDAAAHHLKVAPLCPFMASYIKRHQDYLPLVVPEERDRVLNA